MYLFFTIDKLSKFVAKLKTIFAPIKHTHDAAEVFIDGTTTVGDAAVTNAKQAVTKLKELLLGVKEELTGKVTNVETLIEGKQAQTDSTLSTASKTIVGAINEVVKLALGKANASHGHNPQDIQGLYGLVDTYEDLQGATDISRNSFIQVDDTGFIYFVDDAGSIHLIQGDVLNLPEFTSQMRSDLIDAGINYAPSGDSIGEEHNDGKEYVTLDTMLDILVYCYSLTKRIEEGNSIVDNLEEITDAQIEDLFETASAGEDVAV